MIELLRNGSSGRVREACKKADQEVDKTRQARRRVIKVAVESIEEVVARKKKEIEEEG